jgi:general secretion pathway protein I
MRAERGFTLIEVLVALGIFVAAALALDSVLASSVQAAQRFEEQSLATWVASNKLVELQVYQQWPSPGRQDDEAEFAGRRWFVETTIAPGPYGDTLRADIRVGPMPDEFMGEKQSSATLTGLLVKPAIAAARGGGQQSGAQDEEGKDDEGKRGKGGRGKQADEGEDADGGEDGDE